MIEHAIGRGPAAGAAIAASCVVACRGDSWRDRRRERGVAFVESLLALPIVLLLGLGALQWALLLHARTALEYALVEAARAGSVAQARPESIEAGLARGLMPFWQGSDSALSWAAGLAAARTRLQYGLASGWIAWRQLAPTVESFGDWGEPARDAAGYPMPQTIEIPNDSLRWASLRWPAGGVAGMRGDEPIGARSQQTLTDANLLRLELRYGVPMSVPLVGHVAVWVMRIVDGCAAPSRRWLGTVDLGVPVPASGARPWACAMYLAPEIPGASVPRWPVRVAATVRMQSPARRSAMTPARTQSAVQGAASGAGLAGPSRWPDPVRGSDAAGGAATPESDGSASRSADGWLDLGGERTFSVPGACA